MGVSELFLILRSGRSAVFAGWESAITTALKSETHVLIGVQLVCTCCRELSSRRASAARCSRTANWWRHRLNTKSRFAPCKMRNCIISFHSKYSNKFIQFHPHHIRVLLNHGAIALFSFMKFRSKRVLFN